MQEERVVYHMWFTAITVALLTGISSASNLEAKKPVWSVLSLRVERPMANGQYLFAGVKIRALLHLPGSHLCGVQNKGSALTNFADDQGTDLSAKSEVSTHRSGTSDDGKYCVMELCTPHLPAANATKLRLKGIVVVLAASGLKTLQRKDLAFDRPIELDLGIGNIHNKDPFTKKVGKLFYSGRKPIKSATILDGEGKQIGGGIHTGLQWRRGDEINFHGFFHPEKKVERGSLQLIYFDTIQALTVPFDLEVGLGL